jgi:hypothetical protein
VLSCLRAQVTFTTTRQLRLGLFQDFIISQLPAGVLQTHYLSTADIVEAIVRHSYMFVCYLCVHTRMACDICSHCQRVLTADLHRAKLSYRALAVALHAAAAAMCTLRPS